MSVTPRSPATTARRAREQAGRTAEAVAALFLIAKGYRILGRRLRSRLGEIDIVAKRGRRLAFVEVKARSSLAAGHAALADAQARRIHDAAERFVAQRPHLQNCELGFDAVIVTPWRLPVHLPNALQPLY